MNKAKTELFVGLFVLLTIAALVLLSMRVVNQNVSTNGETYTLYAKFDNIGSLRERSAVKVGGVTVGRVTSIKLDPEDFSPVVELSISTEYSGFPETSSISILTAGLLGEQYLGLQPGFSFDGIENLRHEDFIQDTKSALVLEDLIGQFLFNSSED
jgi:phospholipid/cholesterol/gamma-HCH transport system substrate-binding protein